MTSYGGTKSKRTSAAASISSLNQGGSILVFMGNATIDPFSDVIYLIWIKIFWRIDFCTPHVHLSQSSKCNCRVEDSSGVC